MFPYRKKLKQAQRLFPFADCKVQQHDVWIQQRKMTIEAMYSINSSNYKEEAINPNSNIKQEKIMHATLNYVKSLRLKRMKTIPNRNRKKMNRKQYNYIQK